MRETLRAGASRVELPVACGLPMMGYGARHAKATGVHDPLYARALFLEEAREGVPAAAERALLVECDLCLLAVAQCDALRARIARETGIAAGEIALACIHTHSGPDSGLAAVVMGQSPPDLMRGVSDAIVEAATCAVRGAAPAQLAVGATTARIGRNRRAAGAPIDERVLVLRVDRCAPDSPGPLAVLYVHGCHPTVLGHENLAFSADWPGAASATIEAAFPGALAVFALGAHADVDPRTRGLQDLAEPGRSQGATFAEVEALGREVGEAVASLASGLEPAAGPERTRVRVRSTRVGLTPHAAGDGADARACRLEKLRTEALAALDLPPDSRFSTSDFYQQEHARTRHHPSAERRERIARVRLYLRDRQALRLAGAERVAVEVQLFELGALRLLALPIEITAEVGLEWARRAQSELAGVISIANGWLRYLPHARHFDGPTAHHQYEVLNSTFRAEAAERLLEAGSGLLRGG